MPKIAQTQAPWFTVLAGTSTVAYNSSVQLCKLLRAATLLVPSTVKQLQNAS